MMKKMLLLAGMALAAIAFAVPAAASANTDVWELGSETLGPGEEVEASYEGFLEFVTPGAGTLGCEVTVEITAEGPSGGTVDSFTPTTSTCIGTGLFAGCELIEDTFNPPWGINLGTPGSVGSATNPITIHNIYRAGSCPPPTSFTTSHLVFNGVSHVR